jgi:hypothetical protein
MLANLPKELFIAKCPNLKQLDLSFLQPNKTLSSSFKLCTPKTMSKNVSTLCAGNLQKSPPQ